MWAEALAIYVRFPAGSVMSIRIGEACERHVPDRPTLAGGLGQADHRQDAIWRGLP